MCFIAATNAKTRYVIKLTKIKWYIVILEFFISIFLKAVLNDKACCCQLSAYMWINGNTVFF